MKKKLSKFELVCYIVAAVLAVCAIYMLYANVAYISDYLTAYGMTMSDVKDQVVQTVISAFAPYFTYAFTVFGIGKIYGQVKKNCCTEAAPCEVAEAKAAPEVLEAPVEKVEAEVVEAAEVEEAAETIIVEETKDEE